MPEPIAWIHEDTGEDGTMLEGRFSALIDDANGAATIGPQEVTLIEALTWARKRAQKVIVTSGGERYTAGKITLSEYAPLPDPSKLASRRRHPAFAYLDREPTESPIDWPVELDFFYSAHPLGAFSSAFVAAVAANPLSRRVTAEPDPESHRIVAIAYVYAATHKQAEEIGTQIVNAAIASAGDKLPEGESSIYFGANALPPER